MAGLDPYTPGAGTRPLHLPGRAAQIALVNDLAEQVEAGRSANPMIYAGLRGVGKTSLLYEARDALSARGWLAGYYEVRRSVEPGEAIRSIITESAARSTGKLRRALSAGSHSIDGVKLKIGATGAAVEVASTPVQSSDPYPELVRYLRGIGADARMQGVGVALILDEIQVFRKRDLTVLVQALAALADEPIALIGAGLPYLAAEMAKSNTYAERFRFETIDRLNEQDSRTAIVDPALDQGTTWDDDALARILSLADGYPYFLQLFASETWRAAGDAAQISLAHVEATISPTRRQLDAGIYSARYGRLSAGERAYVNAMVDLGSARVASGDVARLLERSLTQLSTTRDRIIRKGIIHAPVPGALEFSVPGFADYVQRHREPDE